MARSLIDRDALRAAVADAGAGATGRLGQAVSRRAALGLAGATAAGVSPALRLAQAASPGTLTISQSRYRVVFSLDGTPRWTIDTRRFAGSPRLELTRAAGRVRVTLTAARYPGTPLPANLALLLRRTATGWRMHLDMALGGFAADAAFERWLLGLEPARGPLRLPPTTVPLGTRASLFLGGEASAAFAPDWLLTLDARAIAAVRGLGGQPLPADTLAIEPGPIADLAQPRAPLARRTLLTLQRGEHAWHMPLPSAPDADAGWALEAGPDAFETLRLDLGEGPPGVAVRTLIAQGAGGDEVPSLSFRPHHALTDHEGRPFALGLTHALYAVAFHPAGDEAVLIARYHQQPGWLRVGGLAVEVGVGIDTPPFEVAGRGGLVEAIRCTPAVLRLSAPLAGAVVEPAACAPGTHLAFVTAALAPAALTHPVQVHVSNVPIPRVRLRVTDPTIAVLRPDDLLSLRFGFAGLTLAASSDGTPELQVDPSAQDHSIAVYFQGQNIAEQAFFTRADNYPVPPGDSDNAASGETPSTPVGTRLAGDSRLVFAVPPGTAPIPYTLESLLDWQGFDQQVAATAQLPNGRVKATIAAPGATETAIEVPWRLILSPNRLAAWIHALAPVTRQGRTELWHTRLGVRLSAQAVQAAHIPASLAGLYDGPYQYTPTDAPDGRRYLVSAVTRAGESNVDALAMFRTVRAIWSPDYVQARQLGENIPFRMSLTGRDRAEIVALSADFSNLPRGARFDLHPLAPASRLTNSISPASQLPPAQADTAAGEAAPALPVPAARQGIGRDGAALPATSDRGPYLPTPIAVDRLMLSALGAWIDVRGAWGTNTLGLALEEWRHRGTMGRDHYVRVVYRGYLFPLGHRASLVKITERKFYPQGGKNVAYLLQRMFIIVREPLKGYGPNSMTNSKHGTLNDGQGTAYTMDGLVAPIGRAIDRWMPFKQVRIATLTTPNLDVPALIPDVDAGGSGTQSTDAFWPRVGGQDFLFHLIGQDVEGQHTEFTAPLAFVTYDHGLAFDEKAMRSLALRYASSGEPGYPSRRTRPANGQDLALAPSSKPGNTTLHAQDITFGAFVPSASVALYPDQPRFFPILAAATVRIPALEALLRTGQAPQVRISDHFLSHALGGDNNAGEVFAEIIDAAKPTVSFGGTGGTGTPGVVTPNVAITGLSRILGPVGGDLTKVATGNVGGTAGALSFITDFFSDSAKILGAIPLSAIIDLSSMLHLDLIFKALSALQSLQNSSQALSSLSSQALDAGKGGLGALTAQAMAALQGQFAALEEMLGGLQGDLKSVQTTLHNIPSAVADGLGLTKPLADLAGLIADVGTLLGTVQTLLADLEGNKLPAAQADLAALPAQIGTLPADLSTLLHDVGSLLQGGVPLPQLTNNNVPSVPDLPSVPKAVDTTFTWSPKIKEFGPFKPGDKLLTVSANVHVPLDGTAPSFKIQGVLGKFVLDLFNVIKISFEGLSFTAVSGQKVDVVAGNVKVSFEGPLAFVNDLTKIIPGSGFSDPPFLDVEPDHIAAGFTLDIPSFGVGIFSLQNISLGATVTIPFIGVEPARLRFNFCTRDSPFLLTIALFGGGGFFGIGVGLDGLDLMEAAFEFGGNFSLDIGVASGGVYVMAGIYFKVEKGPPPPAPAGDSTTLTGFVRMGGGLEVLGLVSISIEFYMGLTYEKVGSTSKVYGDASLTVEVSVLFFSASVSLSVHREFGGSDPTIQDQISTEDVWDEYIDAFAS